MLETEDGSPKAPVASIGFETYAGIIAAACRARASVPWNSPWEVGEEGVGSQLDVASSMQICRSSYEKSDASRLV